MGVDVIWKDAAGLDLDSALDLSDWFAIAIGQAQDERRADAPVLSSIDLYRETRILPPRTAALAMELAGVRDRTLDVEARIHLGRVMTLANAASAQPDTYLLCVGD
jgi:hypothetical protein